MEVPFVYRHTWQDRLSSIFALVMIQHLLPYMDFAPYPLFDISFPYLKQPCGPHLSSRVSILFQVRIWQKERERHQRRQRLWVVSFAGWPRIVKTKKSRLVRGKEGKKSCPIFIISVDQQTVGNNPANDMYHISAITPELRPKTSLLTCPKIITIANPVCHLSRWNQLAVHTAVNMDGSFIIGHGIATTMDLPCSFRALTDPQAPVTWVIITSTFHAWRRARTLVIRYSIRGDTTIGSWWTAIRSQAIRG